MEGLTAKQRKNLKKKQQRKKKKAQANNEAAGSDDEESAEEETKNPTEAPKADPQQPIEDPSKKKKQVKKASIDGRGEKQIGNLLNEDDDDVNGANQAFQQPNQGKSKRGPKIDENVMVKICDMGNGCWTYHHFTPEIQTRQYRSPEVIIGADYDTSADIWSLACTVFEMVTGDFLFEPRKGNNYDKDDDHLA